MADRAEPAVRTIPVQRIRPGEHACTTYAGAAAKWPLLDAFVRQGVLAGDKVLVLLHPKVTGEELLDRLGARGTIVQRAWRSGQLELTSMRELLGPGAVFSTARQSRLLVKKSDLAVAQGFAAARAYIDMDWVADLGIDLAEVLARESSVTHLFDGRPYSEVCAYDENLFHPDVLRAVHAAHPVHLLGQVGSLLAVHASDRPALRLVGEADIATATEFDAALRTAFAARAETAGDHLSVDLSSVHFLSAGCAAQLLRHAGRVRGPGRTTLACTATQRRILRRLGADTIDTLVLVEATEEGRC